MPATLQGDLLPFRSLASHCSEARLSDELWLDNCTRDKSLIFSFVLLASEKGDIVGALQESFLRIDDEMLKDPLIKDDFSGCTAVSVLLKGGKIFCVS